MEFKKFFEDPPIISAFSSREKGLIEKPFWGLFKRSNFWEAKANFLEIPIIGAATSPAHPWGRGFS